MVLVGVKTTAGKEELHDCASRKQLWDMAPGVVWDGSGLGQVNAGWLGPRRGRSGPCRRRRRGQDFRALVYKRLAFTCPTFPRSLV